MGVRKTESRIPANFKPDDLGQSVVGDDGRCALVSFITSPLVIDRENTYVVFVTDAALAGSANLFEWSFTENGGVANAQTTEVGEVLYRPKSIGMLSLVVRILGAGNAEQANLKLDQEITQLNPLMESKFIEAQDKPGSGAANIDVSREIVNDYSLYYRQVTLQTPENGDGFKRFLFSMIYDGVLQSTEVRRKQYVDQLAETLNNQGTDFVSVTSQGLGICGVRLTLLAMMLPQTPGNPEGFLKWTELPEASAQRAFEDEKLRQSLSELADSVRIDLFNLVRFPKSNIVRCGSILEGLRNRYFSNTKFDDVLLGMSGVRADWIAKQYREGPIKKD
jgi:hypothetical protein